MELTLRTGINWEPVPDVVGTLEDFAGPYPAAPVDVVIEVLSPQDTFALVEEKCERYAHFGVKDILVFDPIHRKAWRWETALNSLIRVSEALLSVQSNGSKVDLNSLWIRLESER